ncbi:MAG: fatty acid desaturase [Isosphaeraceae bacterium]|nr:fatty acid desaturase [Isosphaeraceae bacterium]
MDPRPTEPDLAWNEVVALLRPDMKGDRWTNVRCIAREYAGLTASLALAALALDAWSTGAIGTAGFALAATPLIALVAAFQHRLSGLAHDASHGVLFPNRLANELASDLLLLFPLAAMTQKYRHAHLGHHRHVNDPERDPDWIRLQSSGPLAFPMSKREFLRRFVWDALRPPTLLRYLFGRARAANFDTAGSASPAGPRPEVYRGRVARCLRGAYWISMFSVIHLSNNWALFALFWVVPLLTFYPFWMQLREIAHHANALDAGDFTNSRVFDVHPLTRFAIFPYGQDFHLTHHLFDRIPHHRIARAHTTLLRYPPYRESVVVCRGYFARRSGTTGPSLLDLVSTPPSPRSAYAGPHRAAASAPRSSETRADVAS